MANQSWADVVGGRSAKPTSRTKQPQQFMWKAGKNGTAKTLVKNACNGVHCSIEPARCTRLDCIQRLTRELDDAKKTISSLNVATENLFRDLDALRADIFATCKTDAFTSEDMEASRKALVKANHKKIDPEFCECTACQLEFHKKQVASLSERKLAAQARITALKEYRRAHDKETLYRTSSKYAMGGTYFTPVGSTKAKGVTALKPTLQLQHSYNLEDLRCNSMASKPLKVGWKDKPKPMRVRVLKIS
jgi:hypothetical protein